MMSGVCCEGGDERVRYSTFAGETVVLHWR